MRKDLGLIRNKLNKLNIKDMEMYGWHDSIVLKGKVSTWEDKIKAGYTAVNKECKGVINDIEVDGIIYDKMFTSSINDRTLEGKYFDVLIIGGGVIGSSIARELSKFDIKIALLDKEEDIAKHSSGRNDGMIHPGFAPKPKSKKAFYNIRGNAAYSDICRELGVKFKRIGSIFLFRNPFSKCLVPLLINRAKKNNVDGYKYLNKQKVKSMEPYITDKQHGGFFLPSAGILSPYKLTIASAENSVENGVEIFLNTAVLGFEMNGNRINMVKTNRGTIHACLVVNAAGIWADKIADFANDRFFSIHPRKGMDAILDIRTGKYQTRIVGMPSFLQVKEKTKGGGLVPTIEGNLLIGPTAEEVPYREDYSTDAKTMEILLKHLELNTMIKTSDIITYFSGTRACTYEEDFIVEASEYVENLVHAAGIQSPGLASAPAIAEDISKICISILKKKMQIKVNERFNPYRKAYPELNDLSLEERAKVIKENPSYGRIICRCETISEGEVIDALNSKLDINCIDAIKRRTRVGTGRCHGGFCTPRLIEIMSEKENVSIINIKKKGEGSSILLSETKGQIDYSKKIVKTMGTEE